MLFLTVQMGKAKINLYVLFSSLGGHFVGVKVSAGLAAALVPAHVLAQVLISDHPAVNRPLIPRALVRQCSCQE